VGGWKPLSELPYAAGLPRVSGDIRSCPEDFRVDEILGFEPDGSGEHVLLQLSKRNTNTEWLARRAATVAGVPMRDVSYAGLKDRHALTNQWFSVRMAGRPEPDWRLLEGEDTRVLRVCRHGRKLRRGVLEGNHFVILVRNLQGDLGSLSARLQGLREGGMPNYFGEQRFGHEYGNLARADQLFSDEPIRMRRHQRGLCLSAVRSQLFNEVLGRRLALGNWDRFVDGDALMPAQGERLIINPEWDDSLLVRVRNLDLHPTGPLWGTGKLPSAGAVRQLEESVVAGFSAWREGLEKMGLRQARRPLRAAAGRLSWRWPAPDQLELNFTLPAGSYATMLLRELVNINNVGAVPQHT
jgi:tRNA pseudouridine13 synthase